MSRPLFFFKQKNKISWFLHIVYISLFFVVLYINKGVTGLSGGNLLVWIVNFVIFIFSLMMAALTWSDIIRTLNDQLSCIHHAAYYVLTNTAKRLPGTLWYIVGRGVFYRQHTSLQNVIIASGIEIVVQVVSGIFVASISYVILSSLSLFQILAVLIGASCLMFFSWKVINKKLVVNVSITMFVRWTGVYTFIWCAGGLMMLFIGVLFSQDISLSHFFFFVWVWSFTGVLSTLVFFLPFNFGITEISITALLSQAMPSQTALLVAISIRAMLLIFELLSAGMVLLVGLACQKLRGMNTSFGV